MSEAIWHSLHEHAEPWAFAKRRALLLSEVREGTRWLDLGCGPGHFTGLAPGGVGVDIAPAALERARANVPGGDFRLMDGDAIPLGHGEVDFVWCSHVLEHVPDALGLLQEARRVLAPRGRLLVTVPWTHPLKRLRGPDPMGGQVRFFTPRSLRLILAAAGFTPRVRPHRGMLVGRGTRA